MNEKVDLVRIINKTNGLTQIPNWYLVPLLYRVLSDWIILQTIRPCHEYLQSCQGAWPKTQW